jgi:hypothetical protein
MASSSFNKRQKEKNRLDKQREKLLKRHQRSKEDERPKTDASGAVIDPDIAGIVPGPQPLPEG